jgi:hypothetical protein
MDKFRAIGAFLLTTLLVAASIAQILQWLEIKPKEFDLVLKLLTAGQLATLGMAAFFILAALGVAGYSLRLSFHTVGKL